MKIVFMGTPDFAVPALQAIKEAGHEVGYVVTQPDAARDRGKDVKPTPVGEKALELGIPVLQPQKIRGSEEFRETLRAYAPDIIIVAAYGKMLPQEILDIPPLGCINIHASLLPRFRGAAPIQRAIIEGDKETGVTLMHMAEGMDTGDMIAVSKTPIETDEKKKTAGQLHDELAVMGAELLTAALPKIEDGSAERIKQDDSQATYAPMIFKKDGLIDFSRSPEYIERLIRAMDPWPGAFTHYRQKPLKIWDAQVLQENNGHPFGTITDVEDEGISVSAGGKTLLIQSIQFPGKKRMNVRDFLRGNEIEKYIVLG